MIDVNNLKVRYKDITAVDGVSFSVEQGEIFGVIGPNGAGKTTMIECIEGLRQPDGGSISVMGIDPKNRKELYRRIGVQLQESSFPDAIKVGELCRLFTSFYAVPADYRALLSKFELRDREKSYYKKLSGGQKQKISIVLALIADPKIVFLDELTTGLDPKSRIVMWEIIKSLRGEGKTVFMTTHFMDEAEYLCDRVLMMVGGKIAAMGKVEELVRHASIDQKITFTAGNAGIEALRGLPGVDSVGLLEDGVVKLYGNGKNLLRDVVVALAGQNVDFTDLNYTKPGLEEAFLKLTGSELEV